MAFGIGTNTRIPDAGMLRAKQEEIAVDCWFTSTGVMHLRRMKIRCEDEILQIDNIRVMVEECKRYAGVMVREFKCCAVVGDCERQFTIVFYPEQCQWKLLIPN